MADLEPVQSLWIGSALSELERLSLASFLHHGHEVRLYTYGEVRNVPVGVVIEDAREILPEEQIFKYTNRAREGSGSYAGFANWFRYELLHVKGGWWVDTDVVCLRPLDFAEEYCFGFQDEEIINNALIKAPRQSPFTRMLVKVARGPHSGMPWDSWSKRIRRNVKQVIKRRRRGDLAWGQTGPNALTKVVEHLGLGSHAKPPSFFYPIAYAEWELLYSEDGRGRDKVAGSHVVHLWNEMLRRAEIDKDAPAPARSLISEWTQAYLP